MDPRTAAAQRAAAALVPTALRWLETWLTIPSVSGVAAHHGDIERAARYVAQRLRTYAAEVAVVPTPQGPAVVARVRGRDATRPATVIYGHLDVRPAGKGWRTDPFSPVRRGRRLIARGASDDKGQVMIHLAALEAWARSGGPPADVLVVLDPAEELGSPGLRGVLAHPLLDRPVTSVIVSDTRQGARGVPSLTLTQRGVLTFRVIVDAGGPAVHAGRFGGAVRDPSLVLTRSVANAAQVVAAIPADRTRVPQVDDLIRASAHRATASQDLSARTTTRAALTITGLRAGGTPGSVPRDARADLDVRLPPSVAPGPVRERVITALRRPGKPPLTIGVHASTGSRGFIARHSSATIDAVTRACMDGFGAAPIRVASGGSIPAVLHVEQVFGCSPILLGFGPIDDGAHGPDEYIDLVDFGRGVRTAVTLIGRLGHQGISDAPRPLFQPCEFC